MNRFVDLHVHSKYSDGIYSPAELVERAAANGLCAIAIADHDAVEGIDEAMYSAGRFGIEIIPAVEMSVEYGKYHDIHLLGYFIDHRDSDFMVKLASFRQRRDDRGKAIIGKINDRLATEHRGGICYEDVIAKADGALGRPHIARELMEKGYVTSVEDAFRKYLIPCNVPKLYFPFEEAIAEIKRVGGLAVLAHPTSITDNRIILKKLIEEFAYLGLAGIEVYNNVCFADDMIFLESLARKSGLLMTGGSDFHGFEDDIEIGSGRGGLSVAYRLVMAMKDSLSKPAS